MSIILTIVTGSIAAPNAVGLLAGLKAKGAAATAVIMTAGARRFASEDVMRFTGQCDHVVTDDSPNMGESPNHILLARSAEAIIIYPASAGFIGRISNGLVTDVASATLISSEKKQRFLFPSMNDDMWENSILQRNVNILAGNGYVIYPQSRGMAPLPEEAIDFIVPRCQFPLGRSGS